jgi:hypothetical protein
MGKDDYQMNTFNISFPYFTSLNVHPTCEIYTLRGKNQEGLTVWVEQYSWQTSVTVFDKKNANLLVFSFETGNDPYSMGHAHDCAAAASQLVFFMRGKPETLTNRASNGCYSSLQSIAHYSAKKDKRTIIYGKE